MAGRSKAAVVLLALMFAVLLAHTIPAGGAEAQLAAPVTSTDSEGRGPAGHDPSAPDIRVRPSTHERADSAPVPPRPARWAPPPEKPPAFEAAAVSAAPALELLCVHRC